MRAAFLPAACTAAFLASAAGAQQGPPTQHVRGDVVSVTGERVDVRTRAGGLVHLVVPQGAAVARVEEAGAGAVTDGAFVGVTAVPQPGTRTLRALEVHVFPPAMRGAGEGHRPWDLGPGSSMTNATASGMGAHQAARPGTGSSMTNATVAGVNGTGGERTLKLTYPGGEQTVLVPSGTPIVRLTPGDRSLLVPGAHVFAIAAEQAGALVAQRLSVGQGAVVPPM